MDSRELVDRLRTYVEAIEAQTQAGPWAPKTDLRVGPAMCAEAMSEAADMLERLTPPQEPQQ